MARDFSGNFADRLTIGDVAAVDITGNLLTMHCWINPDAVGTQGYFFAKHVAGSENGYFMGIEGGLHVFSAGAGSRSGGSLSNGSWQSVGARRNGDGSASIHLFTAGTKSADRDTSSAIVNSTASLNFGALDSSHPYDGRVAEGAIWDAALTDDEMFALAKGFSPLLVRPQSLKGYWPLLGNASPEPDLKNGNNATVNGTVNKADHPRILRPHPAIYIP